MSIGRKLNLVDSQGSPNKYTLPPKTHKNDTQKQTTTPTHTTKPL